jgi:hypothetical protein
LLLHTADAYLQDPPAQRLFPGRTVRIHMTGMHKGKGRIYQRVEPPRAMRARPVVTPIAGPTHEISRLKTAFRRGASD